VATAARQAPGERTTERGGRSTPRRSANQALAEPFRLASRPASPGALLGLQRAIGNQAVARALEGVRAQEAVAGQADPDQARPEDEMARTRAVQVTAIFPSGSTRPTVRTGGYRPKPGAIIGEQIVAPSGSPTVHAGGGNSCTPGLEVLDWNVAEDGDNWRANTVALVLSGDIHITAWPSNPTSQTVPNTPNPVDGGNINNTAGSPNHWQAAIDDMADYDTTASGGAGANWHSTAASTAHEWAHWNEDYLADAIVAGDWPATNRAIDAITVPKAAHADAAAARTALEPNVTSRFNTFVRAVTRAWNPLINEKDKPGKGGRGYAAGMRVLDGHIAAIRAYANSKGWTHAGTGSTIGGILGGLVGGAAGASLGSKVGEYVGGFFPK
jgi:hypothetical protein